MKDLLIDYAKRQLASLLLKGSGWAAHKAFALTNGEPSRSSYPAPRAPRFEVEEPRIDIGAPYFADEVLTDEARNMIAQRLEHDIKAALGEETEQPLEGSVEARLAEFSSTL